MIRLRFKPLSQKLFFKITLLFTLSLAAIITLQIVTMRLLFEPHRFPSMKRGAIDHAQRLVNDIGIPPDLEKATRIHETLGIQFRIEGPDTDWISNTGMIRFSDVTLEHSTGFPDTRADFTPFGFCIRIDRGPYRILMLVHPKGENIRNVGQTFLLFLIFYTILVITLMYFVMQWLLYDVRILALGMQEIGEGQLDHRMKTRRHDELGQLVHAFNTMSDRIQAMIQGRERLLLDVSHELRSPLTRIRLALEFLEPGETREAIAADIGEVEAMVGELLEGERLMSPHGGLRKTPGRLDQLIQQVTSEFQSRTPGVQIPVPVPPCTVVLDQDRFRIMLRNILDNALRHSEADDPPVHLSAQETPGGILLIIEDHGCGIPPHDLPHIFEPFYRVDKSRSKETGGYGLGLNLVHKIVSAHGGSITLDSTLGRGTTVRIKLPSSPVDPADHPRKVQTS